MVNFGRCEHLCAHTCLTGVSQSLTACSKGQEGVSDWSIWLIHPVCHTQRWTVLLKTWCPLSHYTHVHMAAMCSHLWCFINSLFRNARMMVDTIYTHRKFICRLHLKWAANHCNRIIEAVNWTKSGQFVNESLFLWIGCSQIEMILSLKSPVYLTIKLISPKTLIIMI